MKFKFSIKHNGVLYPAGTEVPIGKEAKKENQLADKTVAQIKNELKDKYGVTKFKGNSKAILMEQLKEAEESIKPVIEDPKPKEVEEELIPQDPQGVEATEEASNESLLDKIIKE